MTSILKVDTIQDSGGTTGLTIDSTGRVLMPQVPMFQIHSSGNQYVSDDHTIQFDSEEIDIGNNFNTSNYTFTAPINGYYHMHAHVYVRVYSGTDAAVYYKVNGSNYNGINFGSYIYAYAYNNAGGESHESLDVPLIMKLAANDAVTVAITTSGTGAYYEGVRETWWTGHLIGTY
jgi:hypothetical protein